MVTPPAVLFFIHAAAPGPSLLVTRWAVLLPDARVRPLHANLRLLGQRQIGLEVSLHCLGRDFVLFLLDDSFIGQPVHGSIDFFLRSSRIFEDITE